MKTVVVFAAKLAGILLSLAMCPKTLCAIDLDGLREAVRIREPRYRDFSVSVSTTHGDISTNQHPTSIENLRILQWRHAFYSCKCNTIFTSHGIGRAFYFVTCDGSTLSTYTPPDAVEHDTGDFQPPVRFDPYEILLATLGQKVTLSKFLSGDDSLLQLMRFEIGAEERVDGLNSLPVRGILQLPGEQYANIIDLRLAVDYGYLPCWGESITMKGDVRRLNAKAVAARFSEEQVGRLPLMQEIRTTTYPESASQSAELLTVIQIEGESLSQMPPKGLFELKSFVGNPKIRHLTAGKLQAESLYRPKKIKQEMWPPEIQWLVINDVVIVIGVVIYSLFRALKFTSWLFFRCFRKCAATSSLSSDTAERPA